ncbi:DpnD/PcfM family protein [Streptococcus suis]|uniref:DpnD/PcfM family protein n=1 Tax=Streptococcus suis TaxID=1307 RepID=UPI002412CFDB|nr:DpnD/PcfM family protein [Streptococcus suis]MDG4508028.1 DpnD/PcfM family protein [Streptococcus suis]
MLNKNQFSELGLELGVATENLRLQVATVDLLHSFNKPENSDLVRIHLHNITDALHTNLQDVINRIDNVASKLFSEMEQLEKEEALQVAHDMYMSEEIILDANDFQEYSYGLLK